MKAPGKEEGLLISNCWPSCVRTTHSVFHGSLTQCASDTVEKPTKRGSLPLMKDLPHREGSEAPYAQVWKSPCDPNADPVGAEPISSLTFVSLSHKTTPSLWSTIFPLNFFLSGVYMNWLNPSRGESVFIFAEAPPGEVLFV